MEEISIKRLHQHPKNVRRNYGDLTELTESIRENGILQNLTVVPDPAIEGDYLVVIGNCRLQAARDARLSTVPCQVVEMSEQEQIQTMLVENMQRRDLTVIEEAKGVQMCIDLGIKPGDLAKKTGLSKRTIYERKAIAKLDLNEERPNATIQEYLKVAELKEKENQDELLKVIGTPNFTWKYNELRKKEESAAFFKTITPYALGHAKETQDPPSYGSYGNRYDVGSKADLDKIPWEDDTEYVFRKSTYSPMITVYELKAEEDDADEDDNEYEKARERWEEATAQGKSWAEIARTSRMTYIQELIKESYGAIDKDKLIVWMTICGFDREIPDTGIYLEVMEDENKYDGEELEQQIIEEVRLEPRQAIVLVYSMLESFSGASLPTMTSSGKYMKSETYQRLYDFMHDFGYRPSTEEKKLLDGTHEIYIKKED